MNIEDTDVTTVLCVIQFVFTNRRFLFSSKLKSEIHFELLLVFRRVDVFVCLQAINDQ